MKVSHKSINNRYKENRLIILFVFCSVIIVSGISYAYFSATVSNDDNQTAVIETGTLALTFSDGDNGVSASLSPGDSIIKRFTIENTGSIKAYAKINWIDLTNTYLNESLSWKLSQSNSLNGNYLMIGWGTVPVHPTKANNLLIDGLLIPTNIKYYYKLEITLNNLKNVNQTSDINAHMNSKFNLEGTTVDVITFAQPSDNSCTNTLVIDDSSDHNLRYVGANPCNYVKIDGDESFKYGIYVNDSKINILMNTELNSESSCNNLINRYSNLFNGSLTCYKENSAWFVSAEGYVNEYYNSIEECNNSEYAKYGECQLYSNGKIDNLWRIIGYMNNVDDGNGHLETRIKLIRSENIGSYSWDTSDSSVNNGYGVNEWSQSDLKVLLNEGPYWNSTAGTCYNGQNNATTNCDFSNNGMPDSLKGLIKNAKWDTGNLNGVTGQDLHNNHICSSSDPCNDNIIRNKYWLGKVGLMSKDDFYQATAGNDNNNREYCFIETPDNYETNSCYEKDWLFLTGESGYQSYWTMTNSENSASGAAVVCIFGTTTSMNTSSSNYYIGPIKVKPAVYLRPEVKIISGEGSQTNPYILGIN